MRICLNLKKLNGSANKAEPIKLVLKVSIKQLRWATIKLCQPSFRSQ